jgi:hypothetical protein
MRSSFQDGNAAGNGANECGAKLSKFTYREVGTPLRRNAAGEVGQTVEENGVVHKKLKSS